ncbi:alpha/beta fold hydrolase [Salinarimonas soli]|uniref:Alpha/beta fold hydrolase n=1 Tax=Salinarimonas soli TaxID=1638099 RepID=A0A5B2VAT3_9HYPH|nr:alpha/beta fold hydrolase [Salinarimonas soli]KAA2236094.1 alpha/beta fold hydrolase [Salinarimonas soli]
MRCSLASVNGIDLAYTIAGAGPPLVLVHGFACGRRMWVHQLRDLARDHTVIAYDQRGHGLSGAPERAEGYSPGHLGRDLAGLLDHLGIERCHLVGFSLGGGPALGFALAKPERVASLVLADVGAGAESPMLMTSTARRWGMVGRESGAEVLAEEMLRGEFFKAYASRDPRARCHMRALIRSTPLHGVLHTLSEVLAKRTSLFRMTGALRGLRVPTLVLRGDADQVCRAASKLLATTIPGARELTLAGIGHMAPLEAPAAFNAAVREHAGRHPIGG